MNDFWKTLAESAYNTANTLRNLVIAKGHNLSKLHPVSSYNHVQQAFIDYQTVQAQCLILLYSETENKENEFCKLVNGLVPEENIPSGAKLTKKAVPLDRSINTDKGIIGGGTLNSNLVIELEDSGVEPKEYGGSNKTLSLNVDSTGRIIEAVEFTITSETLGVIPNSRVINTIDGLKGGGSLENTLNIGLDDIGVTPGDYGNETSLVTLTIDKTGRVTEAANIPISFDKLGVVPFTREIIVTEGLIGGGNLEEDVSVSLDDSGVIPGKYGNTNAIPELQIDAKGRILEASTVPVKPLWRDIKDSPLRIEGNNLSLKGITSITFDDSTELHINDQEQGIKVLEDWQWKFTNGELTVGSIPFAAIKNYRSEEIPLDINPEWEPYDNEVTYRKMGNVIYLSGLVSRLKNKGNIIATLPLGYRPDKDKILISIITVNTVQEFCRIDVRTTGEIILKTPSVSTPISWLSLDPISYPVI